MEEQDLREIGISDAQHRRKLLQAARALPKVTTCRPRGAALIPGSQRATEIHSLCQLLRPREPAEDEGPRGLAPASGGLQASALCTLVPTGLVPEPLGVS